MEDTNRKENAETPETQKDRRRLRSAYIFGKNLRFLLERNGLTGKKFAEQIGTSPQTVSSWLTGNRSPHASAMEDVADFFGVPVTAMQDPLGNAGTITNQDITVKIPIVGPQGKSGKDTASFVRSGTAVRLTAAMIATDDVMSPIIHTGDIVLYTKTAAPYPEGSLVVFKQDNGTLTVRRIYLDNDRFIIAADANLRPDTYPVAELDDRILGKAVFVQRNIENA